NRALDFSPLCRTRLCPVVERRAGGPEHPEQVADERLGRDLGWQAICPRCALSDAAEPHLSRRDRSQGAITPWRAPADHRSAALGCGSGAACQQRRRAEFGRTKSPAELARRDAV